MATPSISTPFITLFLLSTIFPSSHSNNHTDFEALLAFKKSTEDPLGALKSWNESTHFCSWNGVSCSKMYPNRVVSLWLPSQGLVGSLSPHIGNLSFLRMINFQNNSFRGVIPEEVGRLRMLQRIEFSNNSFSGRIPENLSNCTNLYFLNLVDNKLIGAIVPEIGSLVNLQSLLLSKNMLSGTIPPFIGNLTNITQLSLANCGLQGNIPESLVNLRKMHGLYLSGNSFNGSIPLGLYNLSRIEDFLLDSNQLHGTIPSNIVFTLPKLSFLSLSKNYFTGEFPLLLLNSSLIRVLQISSNSFTGSMIDLSRLSALENFVGTSNQFKGDIYNILSSLTNSTRLKVLGLAENKFNGSLPDSIGNISTHLHLLDIGRNELSGHIPSSIGNLFGLTILSMQFNNLNGPIPESIGKLHNLQEIYMEQNRLTREVPLSIGNLTLLNYLRLRGNDISGVIPQTLGNCNNLIGLDLSQNNLNGSIPQEIMRLSSISIDLDLSGNALTGVIPSEVGYLKNLDHLDLSGNKLSGTIPTLFSSCVMLSLLSLGGNSLQGEVPQSLGALRGLEYLDLSHNNFTGKIPRFLSEFHLQYLDLSFNSLQGEVPTMGVFLNESAVSLQGNRDLCGGIATLNLTPCSSPNSNKKLGLVKISIPIAGVICLVLAACSYIIMYRRRKSKNVEMPLARFEVPEFLRLSYSDLLNATGGFLESNLLGAGRFGSVYRGTINDGVNEERFVAVKVLNLNIRGADKSLLAECNASRAIRHRNLLKIMSVCDSIDFQGNDFKALVYEFMANGSLENCLHHNYEEQGIILSSIQRLDIAIDIASAVEYLHCNNDSVLVHGDLKPSNILLDEDMVAHVGDFGLSKIISNISNNSSSAQESGTTAIKGTIGYIAPEYGMNGIVSTQGDAYSYGVLLLEMFTKKRPTGDAFEGYTNLQDFIKSVLPNHVKEVVDPFLHQETNISDHYWDCIVSIMRVGVRCSNELPRDRMSMTEVVNDLKKIRNVMLQRI